MSFVDRSTDDDTAFLRNRKVARRVLQPWNVQEGVDGAGSASYPQLNLPPSQRSWSVPNLKEEGSFKHPSEEPIILEFTTALDMNSTGQNPPCNTLYIGNIPKDASQGELIALFSKQRGYKRLCFRTKQNGPMCFVEFESPSYAAKTLDELNGYLLHNSTNGGIRISFAKNPLGVRSGQNRPMGHDGDQWTYVLQESISLADRYINNMRPQKEQSEEDNTISSALHLEDPSEQQDLLDSVTEQSPSTAPHDSSPSRINQPVMKEAATTPDWTLLSDPAERRRIQNRIAQRNYRKKLKLRLEDLERRAEAQDTELASRAAKDALLTDDLSENVIDPEVVAYQGADDLVTIKCRCGVRNDCRFIIPCITCGTWQHIACYYELAEDVEDSHKCIECVPRILAKTSSKYIETPAYAGVNDDTNSSAPRSAKRPYTVGAESSIDVDNDKPQSQNAHGASKRFRIRHPGSSTTATEPRPTPSIDFEGVYSGLTDSSTSKKINFDDATGFVGPLKQLRLSEEDECDMTMELESRHLTTGIVPADMGDGSPKNSPTGLSPCTGRNELRTSTVTEDLPEARLFPNFDTAVEADWIQVQNLLPESWKWDVEYQTGCWTCTPLESDTPKHLPLTIAGAPVVLPVEHQWPPMGGVNPPPDPRPSAPIDCKAEITMDIVRDLFLTFEASLGFYVLISGLLQVIVPENFDVAWASSHLPHKFGGLKVCYIPRNMEATMRSSTTETTQTRPSVTSQTSTLSSMFRTSRPANNLSDPTLKVNDFIEARPKSNHHKEKFSGRIGLKVTQAGNPYLVTSTHVITEAIVAKSHRDMLFGRDGDRLNKLEGDWNEHVEVWAGNEKVGTIDRTFDPDADIYPNGFQHDITLISPTSATVVKDIVSPINNMAWLNRESWNALRQQTSTVKILGPTEDHRSVKSIKGYRPSEILIVGEGIFLNQATAAGKTKTLKDHDMSTWKSLVSRAVLYRVYPDFDPPNGYSGIALYAEGTREDGTIGPGIVGFQSFVQRSAYVQNFAVEGSALDRRLQLGRVAFYGAFEVPDKLKEEYTIV